MEKYGNIFQSLVFRLDEAMKQNSELVQRVKELESKVVSLYGGSSEENFCPEEMMKEVHERHKRRKFVVISGLQEPSNGSLQERCLQDRNTVDLLARKIGVEELAVKQVSRIGSIQSSKPRLVRVKCSSMEMKNSLLRASKNLRRHEEYQQVFINPDLTKLQRERDKALRSELVTRRKAGARVMIRSGRIVELKGRYWNFDREQNFP